MKVGNRLIALSLCMLMLLGMAPSAGAAGGNWSVRFDTQAYGNGTLSVELYDARKGFAPAVEWSRAGDLLQADRTADALFSKTGDYYAIVQYTTGNAAGGEVTLSDQEIEREYDLWFAAQYGRSVPALGVPEESADAETLFAWYEDLLEVDGFRSWYADPEGDYCDTLPTVAELRAMADDYYDPEYDDYDELVREVVGEYVYAYLDFCSPYTFDIEQKRMIIELMIRNPIAAPPGYTPPSAGDAGEEAAVRSVVHLLSQSEKGSGLTVDADFFADCVPLEVTRIPLGNEYDEQTGMERPSYARTSVFFRTNGLTIPAFIGTAEETEDTEQLSANYRQAMYGGPVSETLTGILPEVRCLVAPGEYLVTSENDAAMDYSGGVRSPRLDWETVTTGASGGSVDFTASDRQFVSLTADEDGLAADQLLGMTVELTGGDLGDAGCGASLMTMTYDWQTGTISHSVLPLELKAGNYGKLSFVVSTGETDLPGNSLSMFWERENVGVVTKNVSFTLPAHDRTPAEYETSLAFYAIDDGGTGPFTPGEEVRAELVLAAGEYRLVGVCATHQDTGYQMYFLSTSAAYADGTALTREEEENFVWVYLTAPDETQTVNAAASISVEGIVDLSFQASGVLEIGAGGSVAPAVPTGLQAETAEDAVTFRWDANTEDDLAGYRLYRTDADGWNGIQLGSYGKTARTATLAIDRESWGYAPWYFTLSAYDTDGKESDPCAPVRVNDPQMAFHGTGTWSAPESCLHDGLLDLSQTNGSLTFTFLPDADVAEADKPEALALTLTYRDLDRKSATLTLTLPRSTGYTASTPVPEDAAVLERAVFTKPDSAVELASAEFRSLPVIGLLQLKVPAEDYSLAASFDSAEVRDGTTSYSLTRSGEAFAGPVPRGSYRGGTVEFRIGEERFPMAGILGEQTYENGGYTVSAASLPDKLRLRAEIDDTSLPLELHAWFPGRPVKEADYGEAVAGEGCFDFYVERPASLASRKTICLHVYPSDIYYQYLPDEGGAYLSEEGIPFVRGGDLRIHGEIGVENLTDFMYLNAASLEGLNAPQRDLYLMARDSDGNDFRAIWHWRTKQLDTGELEAGETYELYLPEDSWPFGCEPLEITALADGSNRETPPTLQVFRMVGVRLFLQLRTDELGAGGLTGEQPLTAEAEVAYLDRITREWTPLPGEWRNVTLRLQAEGVAMEYQSENMPFYRVDTDSGLRLTFGTEANLVHRVQATGENYYLADQSIRLCAGQVFYTVPAAGTSGEGLRCTGLGSYLTNYPESVSWFLGELDAELHGAETPAVLHGLHAAQMPQLKVRTVRTILPDTLNLVLREQTTGVLSGGAYELNYNTEPQTLSYSFPDLPYGTYDLLLYLGSGAEQTQLERLFSLGEEVSIPASVCGCVLKGRTITENDAVIALDLPAEPVSAELPGIQSITVTPDRSAVLPGERVTYAVRLSCVPGGSESERTLDLDASYRSSFLIDAVSASFTDADGRRVEAVIDGTDKVVLPVSGSLLSGVVMVSGRVSSQSGWFPVFDVAQGKVDRSSGRYVRGVCEVVEFSASFRGKTNTSTLLATGRGAAESVVTVRITSRSDPSRWAEQQITVSRYGYWKTLLSLPAGEDSDEFDAVFYNSDGAELAAGQISYQSVGVLPSRLRIRWEYRNEWNELGGLRSDRIEEIVAYPGENGDFEALNRAVLVFGTNYEQTAVSFEMEFDDSEPDEWGLTPARRVQNPVLYLRQQGSPFSFEYDFHPAERRTFTLTADEPELLVEDIPYSTRWYVNYCAVNFGKLTVSYDLLPSRDAAGIAALAEGVSFPGTAVEAAEFRQLNAALQTEGSYSQEAYCECKLPDFRFEGIKAGEVLGETPAEDPEEYLILPYTGSAGYRADRTLTFRAFNGEDLEEAIAGFSAEEGAAVRLFTASDSFLRYQDCRDEIFFRMGEDGHAEIVLRTVWNTLVDLDRLPGADETMQVVPGLNVRQMQEAIPMGEGASGGPMGALFGVSSATEQAIGGAAIDISTNGAEYLVDHGKLFVNNQAAAKTTKSIAKGLGSKINGIMFGIAVVDGLMESDEVHTQIVKLTQQLVGELDKSYNAHLASLTCEEGGAAAVRATLAAIRSQFQVTMKEVVSDSDMAYTFEEFLVNIGAAATGFIPVPGFGTVISFLNDSNKDLARENGKFFAESAAWKAFYQAEGDMRRAMAGYDPSPCEKEDDTWMKERRKRYTLKDEGDLTLEPARVLDPSGVVYEGLLSNPLAGVTVTIEYWNGTAWVPWVEAPEFNDQQTVCVTGSSGYYRWDVPDGKWRVKYEKSGYNNDQPVYSGEMDVPPVWLDVNQNMTSDGPFTAEAALTETGVALRFTKPVLAADVSAATVTLLKNGQPEGAVFAPALQEGELAQNYAAACTMDRAAVYEVRVENVRSYAGTVCAFAVPVDMDALSDPTVCAPVEADLTSGSRVKSGRMVTLTCATEGASIWYTLDGSCPCLSDNPSRIAYEGPITLTEDTYLIAWAQKPGLKDSTPAAYIWFCSEPEETVCGRVSADAHSVTAAVWVDLSSVEGYCDVLLAYYSGERYLGMSMESAVNADALESVSLARRFVSARELQEVNVRVMVLRSGGWMPLLPASTLLP